MTALLVPLVLGRAGDEVVVPAGELIAEDLYAAGGTVRIEGVVAGDLVAAGGEVIVSGTVEGDVLAAAGKVRLIGTVGETVRAAGGAVEIEGPVGGDVVAFAGAVEAGENARIEGDLVASGGNARIEGMVGGDVRAAARAVQIAGTVGGATEVDSDELAIEPGARLGSLRHEGRASAAIDPAAQVGAVSWIERQPGPVVAGLLARLTGLAMAFVFGLALIALAPGHARDFNDAARRPGRDIAWGALLLVVVPLLLVLVAITVVGLPLALAGLGLYLAALYLGHVVAGLAIGTAVRRRLTRPTHGLRDMIWGLALGLVILTLLELVPGVGGLVALAALLYGLGAIFVTERAHLRQRRA